MFIWFILFTVIVIGAFLLLKKKNLKTSIKKKNISKERGSNSIDWYFKSPEAAIKCACEYMDCRHETGRAYPAIIQKVIPPHDEFPQENYIVKIASENQPFIGIALKHPDSKQKLSEGDFVMIGVNKSLLFVLWKIKPVWSTETSEWEKSQ